MMHPHCIPHLAGERRKTFTSHSSSNVRPFSILVNWVSLDFILSFAQNKLMKDVTLASGGTLTLWTKQVINQSKIIRDGWINNENKCCTSKQNGKKALKSVQLPSAQTCHSPHPSMIERGGINEQTGLSVVINVHLPVFLMGHLIRNQLVAAGLLSHPITAPPCQNLCH